MLQLSFTSLFHKNMLLVHVAASLFKCCISLNNAYSKAAVWHFFFSLFLPYLCDICWTCRVFTGVTTGVFAPPSPLPVLSAAPHAPTQWIHLHPDYRTNCHAGRKANQILRQQLGEEIAFPLSGRGASPSSPLASGFTGEGEKGKSYWAAAAGPRASRRSSLTHFLPIFTLSLCLSLATLFPLPSTLILTLPISHPATSGTAFLPPVLQMKRNNNYGDRVALAAKLGPLRSQQHIVQPD